MLDLIESKSASADSLKQLVFLLEGLNDHHLNYLRSIYGEYHLFLTGSVLSLRVIGSNFAPFVLDYNSSKCVDLIAAKNAKNSLLVKACKIKPGQKILDLTCGWGFDSLVFASLNAKVVSYEINPLVGILVQYAKLDLSYDWQVDILDSFNNLQINEDIDVVYLDPMFPAKPKGRLADKKMQILAGLNSGQLTAEEMLSIVRVKANCKVVVKLPLKQQLLHKPNYLICGKSIKWAVYL